MLNKQQLRAAARHARELAMDCVNGTAPEFDWNEYCGCAVGKIVSAVRGVPFPFDKHDNRLYGEATEIDRLTRPDEWTSLGLVSHALMEENRQPGIYGGQHAALVFPLLDLADELENAAQRPSAIASDSTAPDNEGDDP